MRVSTKNKIAPASSLPERFEIRLLRFLADLGAQKVAVAFEAHFATGQEVSHCRYCFLAAAGARADCDDEVAQREFRSRFEDLFIFHGETTGYLEQLMSHFVQIIFAPS